MSPARHSVSAVLRHDKMTRFVDGPLARRGFKLGHEVSQANAQFVARLQLALVDIAAIHERAMTRTEVANDESAIDPIDAAVATAEPAVVDANADRKAAPHFDRELLEDDFARTGQRILAAKLEFHGSKAGKSGGTGG